VQARAVFVNLRVVFEIVRVVFENLRGTFVNVRGMFVRVRGMFVNVRAVFEIVCARVKRPRMTLKMLDLAPKRAWEASARADSVRVRRRVVIATAPRKAATGKGCQEAGLTRPCW
jgi:hypothetical protein